MKNLSLILNGVLLVAVCVLFYLHFSSSKATGSGHTTGSGSSAGKVLYINTDSVVMAYNFTKDKSAFIDGNNQQREQLLRSKQAAYENAIRKFQGELPIMTEREKMAKQEQIMKQENELMQLQQQFQQDAMMEEQALLLSIIDTLESFMVDFTKEKEVDYVMGYQKNGTIFYRNPANDVTAQVIEQLNSRYKSTNPQGSEVNTK